MKRPMSDVIKIIQVINVARDARPNVDQTEMAGTVAAAWDHLTHVRVQQIGEQCMLVHGRCNAADHDLRKRNL